MTTQPNGHVCLWCGKGFTPRCDGGKRQVFCRPTCRRAFDAAGRRWVSEAIASGMLSVDALRNGPGATRALFAGVISPGRIDEPRKPIPPTPAERPGEAEERCSWSRPPLASSAPSPRCCSYAARWRRANGRCSVWHASPMQCGVTPIAQLEGIRAAGPGVDGLCRGELKNGSFTLRIPSRLLDRGQWS
jgi:hypothetical protein